jgi:hypothetical protein
VCACSYRGDPPGACTASLCSCSFLKTSNAAGNINWLQGKPIVPAFHKGLRGREAGQQLHPMQHEYSMKGNRAARCNCSFCTDLYGRGL